jgi:hypothetical protein
MMRRLLLWDAIFFFGVVSRPLVVHFHFFTAQQVLQRSLSRLFLGKKCACGRKHWRLAATRGRTAPQVSVWILCESEDMYLAVKKLMHRFVKFRALSKYSFAYPLSPNPKGQVTVKVGELIFNAMFSSATNR